MDNLAAFRQKILRQHLDEAQYEIGIKVSDNEMNALAIVPDEFHGE